MLTLTALSALIWAYLLLFHGRFWQAGPVLTPRVPLSRPDVAIVVPARDEAETIDAVLRSLLAQEYQGAFRVILVDDNSTDSTGAIARGIADPRLTVLTGAPRPTGWSGKLWAVSQGVQEAGDTTMILLTDADIVHRPEHLATLVARAERGDLDMVSEMVELACLRTREERIPLGTGVEERAVVRIARVLHRDHAVDHGHQQAGSRRGVHGREAYCASDSTQRHLRYGNCLKRMDEEVFPFLVAGGSEIKFVFGANGRGKRISS